MEKIIITTVGNIPAETKKKLAQAGCIIVEAKDPDKVKTLAFASDIFTHDLLMSALKYISKGGYAGEFTQELFTRLKAKEDANK